MTRRSVRVDAQFFTELEAQLPADGSIVLFGIDIDLG